MGGWGRGVVTSPEAEFSWRVSVLPRSWWAESVPSSGWEPRARRSAVWRRPTGSAGAPTYAGSAVSPPPRRCCWNWPLSGPGAACTAAGASGSSSSASWWFPCLNAFWNKESVRSRKSAVPVTQEIRFLIIFFLISYLLVRIWLERWLLVEREWTLIFFSTRSHRVNWFTVSWVKFQNFIFLNKKTLHSYALKLSI